MNPIAWFLQIKNRPNIEYFRFFKSRNQTAVHIVASRQTGTATAILRALLQAAGKDIRLKADGVSFCYDFVRVSRVCPNFRHLVRDVSSNFNVIYRILILSAGIDHILRLVLIYCWVIYREVDALCDACENCISMCKHAVCLWKSNVTRLNHVF